MAQSAKGVRLANYILEFSTKVFRGGTVFQVASTIFPNGASFVVNA